MFKIWFSTESVAKWLVSNTSLQHEDIELDKIYESDANNAQNFHRMPTHLKNILYLDAPDLIVEYNGEPVFSIEVSTEAGTGHNAFQRFARIAASAENSVPSFYIYPEAGYIHRENRDGWDRLNPLIFDALEKIMRIYNIPALLYYFPSQYRQVKPVINTIAKGLLFDKEYPSCPDATSADMQNMFKAINSIISRFKTGKHPTELMGEQEIQRQRDFMLQEMFIKKNGKEEWSPVTATQLVPTNLVKEYLLKYAGSTHFFGDMWTKRENTLIYKVDAGFRGDPYPGALAALDYIKCRSGKTFEDRSTNLVLLWGSASINSKEITITGSETQSVEAFMHEVRKTYTAPNKVILAKDFLELNGDEIPRYFMQVRFGSTFTKVKHIRVYSYFCDAILFHDGALWRES